MVQCLACDRKQADPLPVGLEAWVCIVLLMKCEWKCAGLKPVDPKAWMCIGMFVTCGGK